MITFLDLHIHSKYSRACSRDLNLENIARTCIAKGIDIAATGDFTHPAWFKSINEELEEVNESGLFALKKSPSKTRFLLATEISLIYKDTEKTRRVHLLLNAPNLAVVAEFNQFLKQFGYNIKSDGRPILGMKAPELVKLCRSIHPEFFVYPAHIWTPWFSVFGSKSGFNSLEECFKEQTPYIYAYETGLSSDPPMNWRLSALDDLVLISNSDAHSLKSIGREATVFDLPEITYGAIFDIIKNKEKEKIIRTIEFYPEEGMYHYDGHRTCRVCIPPEMSKQLNNICPKCGHALTIGVENRVGELADREYGFRPSNAPDFTRLVSLDKIIAECLNIKSQTAKKVQTEYANLTKQFGSELDILLNVNLGDIQKSSEIKNITEAIDRARHGNLTIRPGFDGQYGEVRILD